MVKERRGDISRRGVEPRIVESCGALIYCISTRRYLFLLRDQDRHSGYWGLVGGKVESNESVVQGLCREIQEEIGDVAYSKIIPIEKFTSDNERFYFHTFLIPVNNEFVPSLNKEHRGYCWVELKDHPRPLHPGVWRSFKFDSVIKKISTMENVLSDVGFEHKITDRDHSQVQ
jgi:8-oxo-dGTP pyrophosphatase MutT (NUDIX family)